MNNSTIPHNLKNVDIIEKRAKIGFLFTVFTFPIALFLSLYYKFESCGFRGLLAFYLVAFSFNILIWKGIGPFRKKIYLEKRKQQIAIIIVCTLLFVVGCLFGFYNSITVCKELTN